MIELILPYPPSVNTYWRHVGSKVLISKEGRAYRVNVAAVVTAAALTEGLRGFGNALLEMEIDLYPPDNRIRDLDNHDGKAIFDSLKQAGVYENDSQIKKRTGEMFSVVKGGKAVVRIQKR